MSDRRELPHAPASGGGDSGSCEVGAVLEVWDAAALPDDNAVEPTEWVPVEDSPGEPSSAESDGAVDEPELFGSLQVVGDNPQGWHDNDLLAAFFSLVMEQVKVEWCRAEGGHRHAALGKKANAHSVGRPQAQRVSSTGKSGGPSAEPITSPEEEPGLGSSVHKSRRRRSLLTTELHVHHRKFLCR